MEKRRGLGNEEWHTLLPARWADFPTSPKWLSPQTGESSQVKGYNISFWKRIFASLGEMQYPASPKGVGCGAKPKTG